MKLPPCGLYRTTGQIGAIPEGRLVYFHNHGDPGPGLYLPAGWKANQMQLQERGSLLGSPEDVRFLEPLPAEGFYRVSAAFYCCESRCRQFEPEQFVQLGYDGAGQAILFLPELVDGMFAIPTQGSRIDHSNLQHLKQLKVQQTRSPETKVH